MKGNIVLKRSGQIENTYDYSYVIVQNNKIIDSVGDPCQLISLRSAAKPFLPLDLLNERTIDHFQLNEKIISLMVSSHNGELAHREEVRKYLYNNGLSERDLHCGSHLPYYPEFYDDFFGEKDPYKRQLFHNCSGKHLFLLLMCLWERVSHDRYYSKDHPVFQKIISSLHSNLSFDKNHLFEIGVDGCGVPCFFVSLLSAALSYQKVANDDRFKIIHDAVMNEPFYIAGSHRIETEFIEKLGVFIKTGSEGLVCVSIPKDNIGIAFKIKSGNDEAAEIGIAALLWKLGIFDDAQSKVILSRMSEKIYTSTNVLAGEYTYEE